MLLLQNYFCAKLHILIESELTSESTFLPRLHSTSIGPAHTPRLILSHFYIQTKFKSSVRSGFLAIAL